MAGRIAAAMMVVQEQVPPDVGWTATMIGGVAAASREELWPGRHVGEGLRLRRRLDCLSLVCAWVPGRRFCQSSAREAVEEGSGRCHPTQGLSDPTTSGITRNRRNHHYPTYRQQHHRKPPTSDAECSTIHIRIEPTTTTTLALPTYQEALGRT